MHAWRAYPQSISQKIRPVMAVITDQARTSSPFVGSLVPPPQDK